MLDWLHDSGYVVHAFVLGDDAPFGKQSLGFANGGAGHVEPGSQGTIGLYGLPPGRVGLSAADETGRVELLNVNMFGGPDRSIGQVASSPRRPPR